MMENKHLTCIVCPIGCQMEADIEENQVLAVRGNICSRGSAYAKEELIAPKRMLTTTVCVVADGKSRMIPVKTSQPIPKSLMLPAMDEIRKIKPDSMASYGDILIKNLLETGADIIVTGD